MKEDEVTGVQTSEPFEVGQKVSFVDESGVLLEGEIKSISEEFCSSVRINCPTSSHIDDAWNLDRTSNESSGKIILQNKDFEWVMEISSEGIEFNREAFPDWEPDKFAQEVVRILEDCYSVSLEKVRS